MHTTFVVLKACQTTKSPVIRSGSIRVCQSWHLPLNNPDRLPHFFGQQGCAEGIPLLQLVAGLGSSQDFGYRTAQHPLKTVNERICHVFSNSVKRRRRNFTERDDIQDLIDDLLFYLKEDEAKYYEDEAGSILPRVKVHCLLDY